MKYRLVKQTTLENNRCDLYIIQKKVLWWWEFVDCTSHEQIARDILARLRDGEPLRTEKTIG